MFFRFKKFQNRLLFLFLGLLTALFLIAFAAVNAAIMANARGQIEENLEVARKVFDRLIQSRSRQLAEGAYILSTDFAFKRVISTYDHGTILSALENLKNRINADSVMLASTEYTLLADTNRPRVRGEDFFADSLLEKAEEEGEASSIVFMGEQTHRMVIVPVLAPEPIAWLAVTFRIDKIFADKLRELTQTHITLLRHGRGGPLREIASTLTPDRKERLLQAPLSLERIEVKSRLLTLGQEEYVTLSTPLHRGGDGEVTALLQRSLDEALAPFYRLRLFLLLIAGGALACSIIGVIFTSRSVTRPVTTLVEGIGEIEKGNYAHRVRVNQEDEIGRLAGAFNTMSQGLAERDKVRNLLGKVVSPVVARELMEKEVTLGGEERVMTALFSDIAGFTSISEKLSPPELVTLLNEYLSAMAEIINEQGGVIDKYIGDAIVAFWGAPLPEEKHAFLAVQTAVAMERKLETLRTRWREQGREELFLRIGINTGPMVVGNMGSRDRMDYTMMGDAVNLAARLEGANKYYGSKILISHNTRIQSGEVFLCRKVDKVRVQGKSESVELYEVLEERNKAKEKEIEGAALFEKARTAFLAKDFNRSIELFEKCLKENGEDKAVHLYLERIAELLERGVPEGWQGIYDLTK